MRSAEKEFGPFSSGVTRRKVELNGLILTDTTHSPNQKLPRHRHELANVLFLLKGSFNETISGRTQTCRRLSLFIRPPGELHSNEYDSTGTRCLIIGLESKWRALMIPLSDVLDRPSLNRSANIAGLGLKLRREIMMADPASALSIEGLLLELIAQVIRSSRPDRGSRRPAWLAQTREVLHAHFADNLSLAQLADQVGVHPVHLARTFKHFHKCTIGDYVRNLRIEFAERELTSSDRPLAEIALMAGFCAQSHFSTVFKCHTGLTPAKYRGAVRPRKRGPSASD
jgi:AraC family transcriptional regulator